MLMDGAGVSGVIAMAQERSPIAERDSSPQLRAREYSLPGGTKAMTGRLRLQLPPSATPAGTELDRHSRRDEGAATISSNTGTGNQRH